MDLRFVCTTVTGCDTVGLSAFDRYADAPPVSHMFPGSVCLNGHSLSTCRVVGVTAPITCELAFKRIRHLWRGYAPA